MKPRYKIDGREAGIINQIVVRSKRELENIDGFATMVALAVCHSNGCKLSFDYLLDLLPADFEKEVRGIVRYTNRTTGKIEGYSPLSRHSIVGDCFDQNIIEELV